MVSQLDKPATEPEVSPPAPAPALPPGVNFEAALKSPVFKGLEPDQVREFLVIGSPRVYKANDTIIRQDDTDTDMFVILKGKVSISVRIPPITPGGQPQQKELVQLSVPPVPILILGEMNLLAGLGRSTSVIALEDCDTLVISKEQFEALCERDYRLGYVVTRNITNAIVGNLIKTNERVAKLTTALTLALQKRN